MCRQPSGLLCRPTPFCFVKCRGGKLFSFIEFFQNFSRFRIFFRVGAMVWDKKYFLISFNNIFNQKLTVRWRYARINFPAQSQTGNILPAIFHFFVVFHSPACSTDASLFSSSQHFLPPTFRIRMRGCGGCLCGHGDAKHRKRNSKARMLGNYIKTPNASGSGTFRCALENDLSFASSPCSATLAAQAQRGLPTFSNQPITAQNFPYIFHFHFPIQ